MASGLTVLITCKNEERHLLSCLTAARALADELLVADSGSTDGTLAIARSFGARIIERQYIAAGNFKNWAIPQAKHPWVLIVDADETVTPELATEIRSTIASDENRDGYWIRRVNCFFGKSLRYGAYGPSHLLRLVRRDVGRYVGDTDHAEVQLPTERVGKLRASLMHDAIWSYERYLTKLNRYSEMQAQLWHAEGRRSSFAQIALRGSFRFFNDYFLRGGFLDGVEGLQCSVLTGYASYLKQVRLWELERTAGKEAPLERRQAA